MRRSARRKKATRSKKSRKIRENQETPAEEQYGGDRPRPQSLRFSGGSGAGGEFGRRGQTAEKSEKHHRDPRDTILENMGIWKKGQEQRGSIQRKRFWPDPPWNLKRARRSDVLKRAQLPGDPAEYSLDAGLQSATMSRINHLYEFDCGNQSGWMYHVNGWYQLWMLGLHLKDSDAIVWRFTCKGYGRIWALPWHKQRNSKEKYIRRRKQNMKQGMRKHRFWTKLAAFILAAAMVLGAAHGGAGGRSAGTGRDRPNRGYGSAGGRAVCRAGAKPGGGTGRKAKQAVPVQTPPAEGACGSGGAPAASPSPSRRQPLRPNGPKGGGTDGQRPEACG